MTRNDGPFRYKGSICNTLSYDNRNLNKYIISPNGSASKILFLWPGIADAINKYNYIGKELQNEITLERHDFRVQFYGSHLKDLGCIECWFFNYLI